MTTTRHLEAKIIFPETFSGDADLAQFGKSTRMEIRVRFEPSRIKFAGSMKQRFLENKYERSAWKSQQQVITKEDIAGRNFRDVARRPNNV